MDSFQTLITATDSIILAFMFYCICRGWSKGMARTLLGPLSFLFSCVIAFIAYSKNHNMLTALAITVIGPWILTMLFTFALNIWHQSAGERAPLSSLSRICGSGIALMWSGIHLLLVLLFIVVIPMNIPWLETIRQDVFKSKTYTLVDQWTKHLIPEKTIDIRSISRLLQDPTQMQRVQSLPEYTAITEDQTIRELLADDALVKDITDRNFSKLMANPKIQALLENPGILQKMLQLNIKMMEQSPNPPQD